MIYFTPNYVPDGVIKGRFAISAISPLIPLSADLKLTLLHSAFGPTNRLAVGVLTSPTILNFRRSPEHAFHVAIFDCPGCWPARWGRTMMQTMMKAPITAEATGLLTAEPAVTHRLVEEIPDRGTERPRQDEGEPE